jgi:hypothetical protein
MTNQIETLHALFRALKNGLPYAPENDAAHDLIDRGIEICQAVSEVETDTALAFLKTRYSDIKTARVSGVLLSEGWLRVGIPARQPLTEQVDWARNKGGAIVEITISHFGSDKVTVQEFAIARYFQK